MDYLKKLAEKIDEVLATELTDSSYFFTDTLLKKLVAVHELLVFPLVKDEGFQTYMALFRNDLRLDIQRCMDISWSASWPEKTGLLIEIKRHLKFKPKAVSFAFKFFLKQSSLAPGT